MEIHLNNYLPEAVIFCINADLNGPRARQSAALLFELYPDMQKAYSLTQDL